MSGMITFDFDELPLIIEGGFSAALIDGYATIHYQTVSDWSVREITLNGHKLRSEQERDDNAQRGLTMKMGLFERKPVPLCKASYPWLYSSIVDSLERLYADAIADDIRLAQIDARDDHRAQVGKERARGIDL